MLRSLVVVSRSCIVHLQTQYGKMSQQGEDSGSRGTEEETASPLQWSRGGLAGRITSGREGDI